MKNNADILKASIAELPLSNEFKLMAQQNHFHVLNDLFELPTDSLLQHPSFNHRMMAELVQFCQEHGLDEFID